jgi:D-glycero-beta-D-manno-heptose-7-phosphate kinase
MNFSFINSAFFKDVRVLVIGDSMIDRYYHGSISRMSPEADVPVVDVLTTDESPGGAANVALNVIELGAQAALITLAGLDNESEVLKSMVSDCGIKYSVINDSRPTTVKTRIYNDKQYLLRLDKESTDDISALKSEILLKAIREKVNSFEPHVCILQDYNKGLFTKENVPQIIALLQEMNVPVAVDPKKKNFDLYRGVDLFKPNRKEVAEALGISFGNDMSQLKSIGDKLHKLLNFNNLLLTLSEHGAFGFNKNEHVHFPAEKRNVMDVSGAGDTVVAVAALLLAKGFSLSDIVYLSNLAGGIVIENKGVTPLKIETFIQEINRLSYE